ncbi:MAG: HEAT repeat domain-containing protein [Solirubrobacterales bacterium]
MVGGLAVKRYRVRRLVKERDVDGLLAALDEGRAQRSALGRIRIVNALGKIGDPKAVERLSKVLVADPSAQVRGMAALALGLLGDPSAIHFLKKTLSDPGGNRMWAIRGLGALRDRGSVPWFIGYLDSTYEEYRQFAADALGDIGDQAAVQPLIKALGDSKWGVRQAAATALAKLEDPRALEPLRLARRSAMGLPRRRIRKALSKLESRLQGARKGDTATSPMSGKKRIEHEQKFMFPLLIAISFFEGLEARIRGRRNPDEVAYIGGNLFTSGWHHEAFEFLQKAVKEFPDDPEIRLLYATMLLEFEPDEVAAEAAKAIELDPDEPLRLVRAANLMFGVSEVEAARSYATRARELAPPDFLFMPGLIDIEGVLADHDGHDGLAEEKFRSVFQDDPGDETKARRLAFFLARRDRLEDGVAVLDEALKHAEATDNLTAWRARMVAAITERRES